jgi:hypothetical protein
MYFSFALIFSSVGTAGISTLKVSQFKDEEIIYNQDISNFEVWKMVF